jgi:hypothetical protein
MKAAFRRAARRAALVAAAISGSVGSEAASNTRVAVIGAGASVRDYRFVCMGCFSTLAQTSRASSAARIAPSSKRLSFGPTRAGALRGARAGRQLAGEGRLSGRVCARSPLQVLARG